MSARQKRSEFLTFGYVKEEYQGTVPIPLIKLMQLFTDERTHWALKTEKLKQFLQTKTGVAICVKEIKMKGITFHIHVLPNAPHSYYNEKPETVTVELLAVSVPDNIESFNCFFEYESETLNARNSGAVTMSKPWDRRSMQICPSSELQQLESVCFNGFVYIQCIWYKNNSNYAPIHKMQKNYKYQWNIEGLAMQRVKNGVLTQCVNSNSFEQNNWGLKLTPNLHRYMPQVRLHCFGLAHSTSIQSMAVKGLLIMNGERINWTYTFDQSLPFAYIARDLPFQDLTMNESVSIEVTLQIVTICDKNGKAIDETEWEAHGIV